MSRESETPPELNEIYHHEALDRCHIVICHLSEAFENHPILQIEEVNNKYLSVMDELAEMYQLLSLIHI